MSKSTVTFTGRTMREAMTLAKTRFGSDVEIIGSRRVDDGVELMARVASLPLDRSNVRAVHEGYSSTVDFEAARRDEHHDEPVEDRDARDARMRPAASPASSPVTARAATTGDRAGAGDRGIGGATGGASERRRVVDGADEPMAGFHAGHQSEHPAAHSTGHSASGRRAGGRADPPGRPAEQGTRAAGSDETTGALMSEMRAMRQFIGAQLDAVRWGEQVKRRPAQLRLLRRLLGRGFSASLARSLCDLMPPDFDDGLTDRWLVETLARTLASCCGVTANDADPLGKGGVFALVGPTGVGKTTTIAKLAAQFALRHGAPSVALITADVYRVGAQEQLRAYGRMLGVPVHVAHDQASLRELLGLFAQRKLVLVDTAGVSQRDPRLNHLLTALDIEPVQRIVTLAANAQAATLGDVVSAYRASESAGVILSKYDESVQPGVALDMILSHRLRLLGVGDGQRVPEDFHKPKFDVLVQHALELLRGGGDDAEMEIAQLKAMVEAERV